MLRLLFPSLNSSSNKPPSPPPLPKSSPWKNSSGRQDGGEVNKLEGGVSVVGELGGGHPRCLQMRRAAGDTEGLRNTNTVPSAPNSLTVSEGARVPLD
ncbi:hypothetical protein Q8A67_019469 [Cirrhinus molitorella]|uniref:Uncharacterized protein n=1 Tax=Cirrhinus molitorella TaxID=172907 RepID=A0AA88PAS7_9TELE|nr:hypothetical protein Q8A67_019469 [Cirrhinus molitorella]